MAFMLRVPVLIVLVLFSVIVHEVSHGLAALACGDHTAQQAGRLTLNPLKHIDPIGSVVLPLVMYLLGGPMFAYAKPVPYNPRNLRNLKRDEVLVALAGPASNLAQLLLCAALLRFVVVPYATGETGVFLISTLYQYFWVNISLMLFNLIPLPPLDGSAIVSPFLSGQARRTYYQVQNYAMPILLVVLYLLPSVLNVDLIGLYINSVGGWLSRVLLGGM